MEQTVCQRCGAGLNAVAFLDLERDRTAEGLSVYCGACSKILERDALRSWADQWAQAIAADNQENFFKILAAVWEQGFTKARQFEETMPVFTIRDNPFIAESELADPLKKSKASTGGGPVKSEKRQVSLEEDFYSRAPS